MKTKLTAIAILTIMFAAAFQQASGQDDHKPQVKILPAKENGFIKILFLGDNSSDVHVKFYNDKGLYTSDFVAKGTFHNGFLKKYDIRNVKPGESFWIDVNGADILVCYKMTQAKDQIGYEPSLERMEFSPIVTASKD